MTSVIGVLDKILTTPPEITLASPEEGLAEVKMLTEAIRENQSAIVTLGKRRKKVVLALRHQYGESSAAHVTYKDIAEAMGTTDQSVYKILFPPTSSKKKLADKSSN